jgi:selenocysteine lyase/cysteine desulfurase
MLPVGSQRDLFDIPAGIAYFNIAYNAPLLNAARTELERAAGAKSRPWERTAANFFEDADRLRGLAAEVFGGDADGWAIVPAASYGISAAARAIEPQLKPGDRIVLLEEEFPSNVLPWRRAAETTGAVIVTVPRSADGDWTPAILAEIAKGARVAAVCHCHWTDGSLVDLEAVSEACRAAGAMLVLDATQSLGAMPFDFATIRPDFLVAAGYKWMLCPYGFALMYVGPAWRDARPLEETWLTREGAEDFANLIPYGETYRPGARRFDVGETCVTTVLPGAIVVLEQLKAWGVPTIAASLAGLNAQIAERLQAVGFTPPPAARRASHMFGARLPEGYQGDAVAKLRARNVFVSRRGQSIRFAPHLHVTQADLDQLFDALADL